MSGRIIHVTQMSTVHEWIGVIQINVYHSIGMTARCEYGTTNHSSGKGHVRGKVEDTGKYCAKVGKLGVSRILSITNYSSHNTSCVTSPAEANRPIPSGAAINASLDLVVKLVILVFSFMIFQTNASELWLRCKHWRAARKIFWPGTKPVRYNCRHRDRVQ